MSALALQDTRDRRETRLQVEIESGQSNTLSLQWQLLLASGAVCNV